MGTGIVNATQVGWGNQTPALQTTARAAGGGRSAAVRRRRRKTASRAAPRRRRKTASRATPRRRRASGRARLVKGSAAAKRYMARIRKLRKR